MLGSFGGWAGLCLGDTSIVGGLRVGCVDVDVGENRKELLFF